MLHVCVFIYTVMAKNIGTFGKYDQRIISSLSLLISHFGYFPPNACSVHSSASASMQGWVFYMYLRFDLNENSSSLRWVQYRLYPKWRYADEKRQRGVIFIFFVYKKYSRRFTKIQIEPLIADCACVLCTDEGLMSYLQMYSTVVCYVLFRWNIASVGGNCYKLNSYRWTQDSLVDGRLELFQQLLWQVELPQLSLFCNRVNVIVPLQFLRDGGAQEPEWLHCSHSAVHDGEWGECRGVPPEVHYHLHSFESV